MKGEQVISTAQQDKNWNQSCSLKELFTYLKPIEAGHMQILNHMSSRGFKAKSIPRASINIRFMVDNHSACITNTADPRNCIAKFL